MQAISSKIPFMNYEEGMVCFVSCRVLQLGQRWGKEWILSYTEIPFCIVQNWLSTEFKLFGSEEVIKREKYSWTDNKMSKIRKCFSPQMNFSDPKITSPDYSVCVTYIQKTPKLLFPVINAKEKQQIPNLRSSAKLDSIFKIVSTLFSFNWLVITPLSFVPIFDLQTSTY